MDTGMSRPFHHGGASFVAEARPRRASRRPMRGLGQKLLHCDVPDERFEPSELEKGTEVELEHTDDRATAKCIAKAHLLESPLYYRELEKMERRLEKRKKKFVWKRMDSGCLVGEAAAGKQYPCDIEYENIETGQKIQFSTTPKAHSKMPAKAKTIEAIEKRAGVKRFKYEP
jgi:hypothetical protein